MAGALPPRPGMPMFPPRGPPPRGFVPPGGPMAMRGPPPPFQGRL